MIEQGDGRNLGLSDIHLLLVIDSATMVVWEL